MKTNIVIALVEKIELEADLMGLTLFRYQRLWGNNRIEITYALHNQKIRPNNPVHCSSKRVVMDQKEGKTEKCEAYRVLNTLLIELKKSESSIQVTTKPRL